MLIVNLSELFRKERRFSAKGACHFKPGASLQEFKWAPRPALKARLNPEDDSAGKWCVK